MKIKTRKLSAFFLYPILLAVFIILILLTVYDVTIERSRLLAEMNNKADILLSVTAASAADAFWSYNDVSLKNMGDSLERYQEVAKIKLFDENGVMIYEKEKKSEAYLDRYLYPAFIRPVTRDNKTIGEIQLVFTTYYLNREIAGAIGRGLLKTTLIMLSIMLVILIITKNIANAIDRLAEGVNAFSEGDTSVRIRLKNQFEINKLANRMNTMFDTIVDSSKKLSDQYEALQRSEETLRITEERYRYAVEGSNDAIWDWNVSSGKFYLSMRGAQIVGLSENEIDSLSVWMSFIHPQDIAQFDLFLQSFKYKPQSYDQIQFRVVGCNGETRWLFCRGKGILDQNKQLTRVSGFCTDITERIAANESINRLAYYDTLTGLPNRVKLFDYLGTILVDQTHTVSNVALFYLDLDDFKSINETKGHVIGDKLLVCIAAELQNEINCDFIARIGGDEFVIIRKNCEALDASMLAADAIRVIRKTWKVEENEYNLTCSIGITLYPKDGISIDTLLMNADNAMYQAKNQGRDQFKFYEQSMNEVIAQKTKMQNEMRKGLANNEFVVYYQPQVNVVTEEIIGVEALVRWNHPTRGLLPPLSFIGLAEETGLIIPLGEYILRCACRQSVEWETEGLFNIMVSVNISFRQFNKKNMVEDILDILKETGMKPALLDIEITESMAMENTENTIQTINMLKNIGIRFSLDDFGSGYSSLNYLKNLPIDHLKIDKQFIQNVMEDNFEAVVVEAVINIAHSMNLVVVAEGIERKEQHETLKNLNCDRAQGYLFGKPMPAIEIEKVLNKQRESKTEKPM